MIKQNIATAIIESSEGIISPENLVPFIELVTRKLFASRQSAGWEPELINGIPCLIKKGNYESADIHQKLSS